MESTRTPRQRVLFVVRVTLLAAVALVIAVPCGLGFAFMGALTAPGCGGETNPAALGLAYEEVSFPSGEFGRGIPAYWIPGEPGAITVIAVPTGSAGRGDRLDEIAVYQRAGANVLTFNARGCMAPVSNSLGYRDADAVGDALAYVRARPDADADRVGLHGFSAGGATVLMAAARLPELAFVVSQGGYHDFPAQIEQNAPYHLPLGMGALFRVGALIGYRVMTGDDIGVLRPISVIDQIDAPILLIYGTGEPGLDGARQMQRAGGERVTLWEVPGAGHGNYIAVAGADYEARIRRFLASSAP